MALGDYGDVKASVADWLDRSDLTARVPDFIALAEAQVTRRLTKAGPVLDMMGRAAISVNAEFVAVPDDFVGANSILLDGAKAPLLFVDAERIDAFKILNPNQSGDPTHFALVGREYQFWPWNSVTIAGAQKYWQRIPALSDAAPTNWLLELHPDAYLYGALSQTAMFLKDDPRLTAWIALFTNVLADIVDADKLTRRAPRMDAPRPQIPA